jgi:hypothetical protein
MQRKLRLYQGSRVFAVDTAQQSLHLFVVVGESHRTTETCLRRNRHSAVSAYGRPITKVTCQKHAPPRDNGQWRKLGLPGSRKGGKWQGARSFVLP